MQRRVYLTTVAAALGLAGCSGTESESTPNSTETSTETDDANPNVVEPTQTARTDLTSTAPQITALSLAPDWDRPGDTKSEAVSSATVGDDIQIAYQYRAFAHNESLNLKRRIVVYDGSDEQVSDDTSTINRSVTRSGYSTWEAAEPFGTSGWDPGEYRAEVTVRDTTSEETDTASMTFQLEE